MRFNTFTHRGYSYHLFTENEQYSTKTLRKRNKRKKSKKKIKIKSNK